MQLQFEGRQLELDDGETVLECLERHGEQVASSCRSGVCQSCLLRAQSGDIPAAAQQGVKHAWKAQGIFMSCVCRPTGDMVLSRCDAMPRWESRVIDVALLTPRVLRARLERPAGFEFAGGQFMQLVRPADGLARSYSLASLHTDDCLELHVALRQEGRMSHWLAGAAGEAVHLQGPLGECCHVQGEPARPLLLAGTGTGLAPLWGVVRSALQSGHAGPIHLYHGAAEPAQLYLWSAMAELAAAHPQLHIGASVLRAGSEQGECGDPRIETQALATQVLAAAAALPQPRVYLCGNPQFVRGLRRELYLDGTPLERIHADPFVPPAAPR